MKPRIFFKTEISPDDRADLKSRAKAEGMSMSDYFRRKVFGVEAQVVRTRRELPPALANVLRQLAPVANNANQIARSLNAGDAPDPSLVDVTRQLAVIVADIKEIMREIVKGDKK